MGERWGVIRDSEPYPLREEVPVHRVILLARRLIVAVVALSLTGFAALVGIPTLLGYQTYVITTGSMAGTADPGSLVISEPVPVAELEVGDVITYVPPPGTGIDHLVTHRIASIEDQAEGGRLMVTRGDANAADDPWEFVLDDAVQARMSVAVPLAGHPLLWMQDRTTRMLAIGLPAALIALAAVVDVVRIWRDPLDDEDVTPDPDPDPDTAGREPRLAPAARSPHPASP